jgi:excisionase family DNA binding protein
MGNLLDLPFAETGHAPWWTERIAVREVRWPSRAYEGMSADRPLTLTVEQAAEVLGVGRSTAYELVRSGELKCIRLRRRIVIPVAHIAESLGVELDAVWDALSTERPPRSSPPGRVASSPPTPSEPRPQITAETPTLFAQ